MSPISAKRDSRRAGSGGFGYSPGMARRLVFGSFLLGVAGAFGCGQATQSHEGVAGRGDAIAGAASSGGVSDASFGGTDSSSGGSGASAGSAVAMSSGGSAASVGSGGSGAAAGAVAMVLGGSGGAGAASNAGGSGGWQVPWTSGGLDTSGWCEDSDHDGLSDEREGCDEARDTDRDSVPDYLDDDSDGDGLSDLLEAGPARCVGLADTDSDGVPDYIDRDNDGDCLGDSDELIAGTNPFDPDTNRNGCSDLIDVTWGECSQDSNVITGECKGEPPRARVILRVPSDFEGTLEDVSLVVAINRVYALKNAVVVVSPADVIPTGAAVFDEHQVRAVQPGAAIGIVVEIGESDPNLFIGVDLVSKERGTLAHGSVIVTQGPPISCRGVG